MWKIWPDIGKPKPERSFERAGATVITICKMTRSRWEQRKWCLGCALKRAICILSEV
jgi:hypothetical protein